MIYRKLSPATPPNSPDYTIGQQAGNFYVNSPETVAQAVQTRLLLQLGEWFLNTTVGTPYSTQVFGAGTLGLYNQAIQQVILNTQGVTKLSNYSSNVNRTTRQASISGTIDTIYGATTIQVTL